MTQESEPQLIDRCRAGHSRAWDELFDRHYAPAARFIWQVAPDFSPEDVEEVCQDVFLTVIRNLASFKGQSQFQTWLFRIAANKARDFRERRQAAKRGGGQAMVSLQAENPETGLTPDAPSPLPGPDAALISHERILLVRQSLDQLGEPCREIVELRYYADLSYEEIASTLALNPKTVSSRLSKCLARLESIVQNQFAREKPASFPV